MKKFIILIFTLGSLFSCSDPYSLTFTMQLAENQTFLTDVSRVVITLGDKVSEQIVENGNFSLDTKFEINVGENQRMTIRGYNSADDLIAVGSTPLFFAVDSSLPLVLFFNEINTIGTAKSLTAVAATGNYPVLMRNSFVDPVDSIMGYLFFGGSKDGTPVTDVWYYDPYFQDFSLMNPLPVAYSEMSVMAVDSQYIFLYGGKDENGVLSDKLYYYSTSCTYLCTSEMNWAENPPPAMANAKVVELGPFVDIEDEYNGRTLVNAYLLMAGETAQGVDTQIHLVTIYLDDSSQILTIEVKQFNWTNPRQEIVAVATNRGTIEPGVVVCGGDAGCEILRIGIHAEINGIGFDLVETNLITSYVNNPLGVELVDGKVLIAGGVTNEGTPVNTISLINSSNSTIETISATDIIPRNMGSLSVIGNTILISGGLDENGIFPDSQLISFRESTDSIIFDSILNIPIITERLNPMSFALPTGNIAILGGYDNALNDHQALELFTPDPYLSGVPNF
jgi:hypothetical protein